MVYHLLEKTLVLIRMQYNGENSVRDAGICRRWWHIFRTRRMVEREIQNDVYGVR